MHKKGTALFIVLAVLLIVVVLANVILSIVSSHSRSTHHQTSRIQAYYAAQAGMVYAMEKLRTGAWKANAMGGAAKYACLAPSTATTDCIDSGVTPTLFVSPESSYLVKPFDPDIPFKIQITIIPPDGSTKPSGKSATLKIKTDYTYQK